MAVDVCSEISSPRISFSHDLNELDTVPVESDLSLLDPTFDFDFCIGRALPQEISPADELFADGKILPVQIKEISVTRPGIETRKPDSIPETDGANKKRLIEFLSASVDDDDEEDRGKPLRKPFWQFRRSNSDNSSANGLLRSLQFLTRSNSTGSVPNRKASPAPAFPKGIEKQHSLKETSSINRQSNYSSSSSLASINYPYCHYNNSNNNNLSKKPSLRKSSSSRSYGMGNGVRISPVLNIPSSYIGKGTVSLFGLGSFLCSKKSKKKRK